MLRNREKRQRSWQAQQRKLQRHRAGMRSDCAHISKRASLARASTAARAARGNMALSRQPALSLLAAQRFSWHR
jgi:hypothetical protein